MTTNTYPRYDKLLEEGHTKEELDGWKLVRVSEDFRVIALGLPVPKLAAFISAAGEHSAGAREEERVLKARGDIDDARA